MCVFLPLRRRRCHLVPIPPFSIQATAAEKSCQWVLEAKGGRSVARKILHALKEDKQNSPTICKGMFNYPTLELKRIQPSTIIVAKNVPFIGDFLSPCWHCTRLSLSLSLSLSLPLSLPHAFFNLELEKLTPPLAQKEKTTSATL